MKLDLARFRARVLVVSLVVLVCFGLLVAAAGLPAGGAPRRPARAGRKQPHRHRADRAQPRPDPGPQRHRAGQPTTRPTRWKSRPPRSADLEQTIEELAQVVDITPRDRRRFKKLREESKSFESLPHPHPPDRRGGGPLCRAALPLSRCRHQGAAVSQLSLWRAGQPCDRLHRAHQPGGKGKASRKSEDQANYRGTEYIGKLGVEQSLRGASCTASPVSSAWKPRPVAAPCASWPAARPPRATR